MNQRTIDRINQDEIARRARKGMGARILGGFVIIGCLWAVGHLIGGTICATTFMAIGCVAAGALVTPLLWEVA